MVPAAQQCCAAVCAAAAVIFQQLNSPTDHRLYQTHDMSPRALEYVSMFRQPHRTWQWWAIQYCMDKRPLTPPPKTSTLQTSTLPPTAPHDELRYFTTVSRFPCTFRGTAVKYCDS